MAEPDPIDRLLPYGSSRALHLELPELPVLDKSANKTDIAHWYTILNKSLSFYNLEGFIDGSLPEPDADHPRRRDWALWSRAVRSYIYLSLSESITQSLELTDGTIRPPHELLAAVQEIVCPPSAYRSFIKIESWYQMHQNPDESVVDLIARHRRLWRQCNDFGAGLTPWAAACHLLTLLGNNDNMRPFAQAEMFRWPQANTVPARRDVFYLSLCDRATEEARVQEI